MDQSPIERNFPGFYSPVISLSMDRLALLRATGGVRLMNAVPAPGSDEPAEGKVCGVEPAAEQDMEAAKILENFYQLVEKARSAIERSKQFMLATTQKHLVIMSTVDEAKCSAIRREAEELASQFNDVAQASAQNIEAMKKETDKLKENSEKESQFIGVIRIQENQRRYLIQKLSDAMVAYEDQQQQITQRYQSKTERQIKIKYTNPDGSAIDDITAKQLAQTLIENGATSGIFQQSKDVLAQVIETRNDIYRIEQSMRSLNQLFNDLAFLIPEQGEIMDVIIKNIRETTSYTEAGCKELKKARKYKKRSRKKLCVLVIIVVVIIVLFVLAGVLGAKL